MRRKSYNVLFETKAGMTEIAQHPALWRSLFYFTISAFSFVGVCTNVVFSQQDLAVRLGILVGLVVVNILLLGIFGLYLHGLIDALGETAGDVRGLLCILGYTALPFLVLTPVALMSVKLGGFFLVMLPLVVALGTVWGLYLIVRAVEAVYIINFGKALSIVLFALCLFFIVLFFPFYMGIRMVALSFF